MSMPTARGYHAAVEINNKLYVVGGQTGISNSKLNILEIYDPATDSWSTPATTGDFIARRGFTASVANGKIYVIGGSTDTGFTAIVQAFDPATDRWSTEATSGAVAPSDFATSCTVDGKIYVIGGMSSPGFFDTLEVFNPLTDSWSTPPTIGQFIRRYHATCAVVNGKIYIFGGQVPRFGTLQPDAVMANLEVLVPSLFSWTEPATSYAPMPRTDLAASVIDGEVYFIGGASLLGQAGEVELADTLEVYDPSNNTWSVPITTGPFTARQGLASAVVNGKIYVFGGRANIGINTLPSNIVEVFTPSSNSVSQSSLRTGFSVYPNPTTASVTITGVRGAAHVENVLGERESVPETRSLEPGTRSLDLSQLPAGTYFVRIETPGGVRMRRVVKE